MVPGWRDGARGQKKAVQMPLAQFLAAVPLDPEGWNAGGLACRIWGEGGYREIEAARPVTSHAVRLVDVPGKKLTAQDLDLIQL